MSAEMARKWRESRNQWIQLAEYAARNDDWMGFRRRVKRAFRSHARSIRSRVKS